MNLAGLQTTVQERLDDDGTYFPLPTITGALNEAQRLFVLLTFCQEKTVTWSVPAATPFFHMLSLYPDWILAKRLAISGTPLRPVRLSDLDALDATWQNSTGSPSRFANLGFDFLALYQQPATLASVQLTYVQSPPALVNSTDVPAISEQYHPALINFAEYACRQGEGGQEFQKVLGRLDDFLQEAIRAQAYYKAPNLDSRYEVQPFNITRQDLSKLLKFRMDAGKTQRSADTGDQQQ